METEPGQEERDSEHRFSSGYQRPNGCSEGHRNYQRLLIGQKRASRISGLGPHSLESNFPHADFGTTSSESA